MKQKIFTITFILISLLLIIGSITLNINTIKHSKENIIERKSSEHIKFATQETLNEYSSGSSSENSQKEQTNSFSKSELIIIIITTTISIIGIINLLITRLGTISIIAALNTTKKLIYYSIIIVLIPSIFSTYIIVTCDNKLLNTSETKSRNNKSIAVIEITKDGKKDNIKEESLNDDTSVIQVLSGANYSIINSDLYKKAGKSSDKEASIYYGLNSAILIKNKSVVELKNNKIITDADYSSGIFATDPTTTVNIDNIIINTLQKHSSGLVASDGSIIEINNSHIKTLKESSPALKTICTSSEIIANDTELFTNGNNSPLIHSSGKLTATNITGSADSSNILYFDSITSVIINDSKLSTSLFAEHNGAIELFTNISKYERALYKNASLTIENSELSITKDSPNYKTSPMFYITNIDANININNTKLNYGSNILFNITSNSKYGDIEDNSASVVFTSNDQELKGDIIIDEKSSIYINLNNTNYKGKINNNNSSKKVNVVLDKTAKWELTGDSYLTQLTIHNGKISRLKNQIDSNGYNIYYDIDQNEWLNRETIKLPGGGKLIPMK